MGLNNRCVNISIWLKTGSNGCVKYQLAQDRSNGSVNIRITPWQIGREIRKLGTLQPQLLESSSLQFACFTIDHNSAVCSWLQSITTSVLCGLKARTWNSVENSVQNSSFGIWYLIPHSTETQFLLAIKQLQLCIYCSFWQHVLVLSAGQLPACNLLRTRRGIRIIIPNTVCI
jgi:hypothetical protein